MTLPGETLGLNGTKCPTCKAQLPLKVHRSAAGWYLGYYCDYCGPVSKEVGYFMTRFQADMCLAAVVGQRADKRE